MAVCFTFMPDRIKTHNFLLLALGFGLIFLLSCRKSAPKLISQDESVYANRDFNVTTFDSNSLYLFLNRVCTKDSYCEDLFNFYRRRHFQFAWLQENKLSLAAKTFVRSLYDYRETYRDSSMIDDALLQLIDTMQQDSSYLFSRYLEKLELEFQLSAIFFHYANREYYGIDRNLKDLEWYIPRKQKNLQRLIDTLVHAPESYRIYEPFNHYYHDLKHALIYYRSLETNHLIKSPDSTVYSLHPGERSFTLAPLKSNLFLYGDLTDIADSTLWDDTFTLALKKFQRRHGLKTDGLFNRATQVQLGMTPTTRIRQIMINLERMRWVPDTLPHNYLLVNIPEFRLHIIESDTLAGSMNIVVGNEATETSIFSGKINAVIFSPYWNVPMSIIRKEILPGVKRNSGYLRRHHMEVIQNGKKINEKEIDWNRYSNGVPFTIRQIPGPWNALGGVKFIFPNSFDIYLHDTPSKDLFEENKRAFSHGCIRLGEPVFLAKYVLRGDASLTHINIDSLMRLPKEKTFRLNPPLPVYLVYFTTWVDHLGEVNFRNDIYGHDEKLFEEIFGRDSNLQQ